MKKFFYLFRFITLLFFLALISRGVYGQTTITGTVMDGSTDQPLIGATVQVKGSTTGVVTDLEGKYSINASPTDVVVFSYVGYNDQEIQVGDKSNISVTLEESFESIQELVVIGYGTVKKEDLTGSVAVVSSEDLARVPSATLSGAIQGRAAGVLVNQTGRPGDGANIRVRGIGSINSNPNPLYVVDGVITGGLNNVNPNDIESLQILKDASASAIYGADGANGVVIITTKRGKRGATNVSFSAFGSLNRIPQKYELLNAQQYVDFYTDVYNEIGTEIPGGYDDEYRKLYYGEGWEEGTDWQEVVGRQGYTQNYSLRVSGGGENSNFSVSANVVDERGISVGTSSTRYNFRINSDFDLGKYVKIGESFSVSRSHIINNGNGFGTGTLRASPLMRIYNEDNKEGFEGPSIPFVFYSGNDTLTGLNSGNNDKPNPFIDLVLRDNNNYNNNVLANIYVEIKPFDWLSFKTTPSVDGSFIRINNWVPEYESGVRPQAQAELSHNFRENITLALENQVTLSEDFGKHSFTLTGVHHARAFNGYSTDIDASGFNYENLRTVSNSDLDVLRASGSYTPVRWLSYLGRLIYDYDDKYLLTASIRQDGVSRFGELNRKGVFPSASFAWKLNEDLLPNIDEIDMLKFRVGYGQTGYSDIGNFRYEGFLSTPDNFSPVFGVDQSVAPALNVLNDFGNPRIAWEASEMINAGFDVNLYGNKVIASAEYYIKNTNNLIVDRTVSLILGRIGTPSVNLGDLRNQGFEFTGSYRKMEGVFNYEVSATITTIQNEILSLPETIFDGNNIARIGDPVGSLFGHVAERIITPEDFDEEGNYLYAEPSNGVPSPGDLKFTDLNMDGIINDNDMFLPDLDHDKFSSCYTNSFTKDFPISSLLHFMYEEYVSTS